MNQELAGQRSLIARLTLVIGVIIGTVGVSTGFAAQPGIPAQIAALQEDVQMLQQHVRRLIDQARTQNTTTSQLTAIVNSQNQLIGLLQQQNQDLQARLGCMSKTGDDVYFTACNVHIVSGSGATNGTVNGLGNLIVGYNETAAIADSAPNPASIKTGSHNLVVGAGHSYTSYGGLVAGWVNNIAGPYSSITGGYRNGTSGGYSSVTGGYLNEAIAPFSSISGGLGNSTYASWSSITGGSANATFGDSSSISGGQFGSAHGNASSVSGGIHNIARGDSSSVSGGNGVTVDVQYSWAAGTFTSP